MDMMYEIPVIITDRNKKILLKNRAASEKYKKLAYLSDIKRHLTDESDGLISSLAQGRFCAVSLCALGRTKYALVFKKMYLSAEFYIYLLLDTDAKETAYLASDAFSCCSSVKEEICKADKSEPSPALYMLELEINNIRRDMPSFFGSSFDHFMFSELEEELKRSANLQFFSSSVEIIYKRDLHPTLERMPVSSVLLCALTILLGVCDELSSSKRIEILADHFDDTLVLDIKTEVKFDMPVFFRSIDIFESGIADEKLRLPLAICAALFGADDRKTTVSIDGASGKSIVCFEYRIKNYEKRPAGIKVDTGYTE